MSDPAICQVVVRVVPHGCTEETHIICGCTIPCTYHPAAPKPSRPVMMQPKDYRKPNGVFVKAWCMEPECPMRDQVFIPKFVNQDKALAHARDTGHAMEFMFTTIYSVRAT